jgi:hypothetical protein
MKGSKGRVRPQRVCRAFVVLLNYLLYSRYTHPSTATAVADYPFIDDSPPDPTILFTVLYGIYPLNFTSFVRDAVAYLREKEWKGPLGDGDLGVTSGAVRARSQVRRFVPFFLPLLRFLRDNVG